MSFLPSFLTPPVLVGGADMSVVDNSGALHVDVELGVHQALTSNKTGGSLYNYIKVLAKLEAPEALIKLQAAIEKNPGSIDKKNNKGSTALHACGYLKRWDFADLLLRAGSNPSLRNTAGHSFFLTAVRSPGCPWEALFMAYPSLVERHKRYVNRGVVASYSGGDETGVENVAKVAGSGCSRGGVATLVEQFHEKVSSSLSSGDWDWFPSAPDGVVLPKIPSDLAANLSNEIMLGMLAKNWVFDKVNADEFLLIHKSCYLQLLPMCSKGIQVDRLHADMEAGRFELVLSCANSGGWVDQALIEYAEELGEYDLADRLIEIEAKQTEITGELAIQCTTKLTGKNNKKISGRKAKKSKPTRGGGAAKGGHKNRVSKIANLDGPQRDANEFAYREKSPVKAPIIIVKKARVLRESD
jgi:hypothetical protein